MDLYTFFVEDYPALSALVIVSLCTSRPETVLRRVRGRMSAIATRPSAAAPSRAAGAVSLAPHTHPVVSLSAPSVVCSPRCVADLLHVPDARRVAQVDVHEARAGRRGEEDGQGGRRQGVRDGRQGLAARGRAHAHPAARPVDVEKGTLLKRPWWPRTARSFCAFRRPLPASCTRTARRQPSPRRPRCRARVCASSLSSTARPRKVGGARGGGGAPRRTRRRDV